MLRPLAFSFTLFTLLVFSNCFSYRTLPLGKDYVCEIYEPEDKIPLETLEEAEKMYFEAYLFPPLHSNIPLEKLNIDPNNFNSYEGYIKDMFRKDFSSYGKPDKPRLHYLQLRQRNNGSIVGLCVVLHQQKHGHYYIDHIGIDSKFRRQGLATQLLKITVSQFSDFIEISLDTRIFNFPAQALYEKLGFRKCSIYSCPEKQLSYFHYKL
ncbi:MAG: GNAT family N-acetyltransferase [Parachlamydiaceae bacterium]|nr:GNAT family N-acetyltransferase [Parachlamydiaceae bacterium]